MKRTKAYYSGGYLITFTGIGQAQNRTTGRDAGAAIAKAAFLNSLVPGQAFISPDGRTAIKSASQIYFRPRP